MRFAGSQLSNFISGTNFDNIGKAGIQSRASDNNARMVSDSYVKQADINADATVKAAKFGASATRAQGAAAGQSSMFSGLGSMASGIAGGFASMGSNAISPSLGSNPQTPFGGNYTDYNFSGGDPYSQLY